MRPFTDQFSRADPRSLDPPLPDLFDLAVKDAHFEACALVRDVPIEELTGICSAVSRDLARQGAWLVGGPGEWAVFDSLSLTRYGEPRVVCGAYALWRVADVRHGWEGEGAPGDAAQIRPEALYAIAKALLNAVRACAKGYQHRHQDAKRLVESDRARRSVNKRHENTTELHRKDAVLRAAQFFRAGTYKKPTDAARFLMNDIEKSAGAYYTERTVCQWLWDAGWTAKGWPNCPPTQ
jgi:hypothetical protein